MATLVQTAIAANNASTQILPSQPNRRYLQIQNYSSSTVSMFVKFNGPATAGTAGEYEVSPGSTWTLGTLPSPQDVYNTNTTGAIAPTTSVNIITASATANGCINTATNLS